MDTDKPEDAGMGLHVRSARYFHGFGCSVGTGVSFVSSHYLMHYIRYFITKVITNVQINVMAVRISAD